MFKHLLKIMIPLGMMFFMSACGVVDAFKSTEETLNSDVVIQQNTLSVINVPSTGESYQPPTYEDFNSSELPPASVEAKMVKYPTHGSVIFSGNRAIYKPNLDYLGTDFYAFEVYSTYEDTITTYNINLTIVEGPDQPFISGTPPASITIEQFYSFTPTISNGDSYQFTFSATNLPSWLILDSTTGNISGTPFASDIGEYEGIVITATDGARSLSLDPFSITVKDVEAIDPNTPPTIQGIPSTEAFVDVPYSFTPVANDADEDALTFSIANKPTWAGFNSANGKLSGTPGAGDLGLITEDISIYVSDGEDIATLPPFSIEVK